MAAPRTPPAPDDKSRLAARLKFERYVFIAFFAAMTILAVGMLVEFRRQQDELLAARQESEDLNIALRQSRMRLEADQARHEQSQGDYRTALAEAGEREKRRSRDLAQALVQLALDEAQAGSGGRARGRALLEEAERYGAPPYAPLARWALFDTSSPLAPPLPKAAFFAAALSPDGTKLAVARSAHIELVDMVLARPSSLIAHPAQAGQPTTVTIGRDWLVAGYASGVFALKRLSPETSWQVARLGAGVRQTALSASGARLALLDELGILRLFDTERPQTPLLEARFEERVLSFLPLDEAARPLLAVTADGLLIEFGTGTERRQFPLSESRLRRAACVALGAQVMVAVEGEAGATIVHCAAGAPIRQRFAVEGPFASVFGLLFFSDGTLIMTDSLGRIFEYGPRGEALASYRLGADEPPQFLGRAGLFTLGLTVDGAFSCRLEQELLRQGVIIALTDGRALATSQGFACEGLGVWPAKLRGWLSVPGLEQAMPAGRHAVGLAGAEVVVGAARFRESGRLLCTLASGAALFKPQSRSLLLLSPGGQRHELPLPQGVDPDWALAAAQAEAALLNCGGQLYLADMRQGRLQDLRRSATGPLAIDASATTLAAGHQNEVVIARSQTPAPELRIALEAPPRFLGLMFGGSLLAVQMGEGDLAFFDTSSGRRLLQVKVTPPSENVKSMACSENELYIVQERALRVLSLR